MFHVKPFSPAPLIHIAHPCDVSRETFLRKSDHRFPAASHAAKRDPDLASGAGTKRW